MCCWLRVCCSRSSKESMKAEVAAAEGRGKAEAEKTALQAALNSAVAQAEAQQSSMHLTIQRLETDAKDYKVSTRPAQPDAQALHSCWCCTGCLHTTTSSHTLCPEGTPCKTDCMHYLRPWPCISHSSSESTQHSGMNIGQCQLLLSAHRVMQFECLVSTIHTEKTDSATIAF